MKRFVFSYGYNKDPKAVDADTVDFEEGFVVFRKMPGVENDGSLVLAVAADKVSVLKQVPEDHPVAGVFTGQGYYCAACFSDVVGSGHAAGRYVSSRFRVSV